MWEQPGGGLRTSDLEMDNANRGVQRGGREEENEGDHCDQLLWSWVLEEKNFHEFCLSLDAYIYIL